MEEAERIAREEHGSRKLAVISGIGVRSYCGLCLLRLLRLGYFLRLRSLADPSFRTDARLGFKLDGPYMS